MCAPYRGTTLLELLTVLTVTAILAALVVPRLGGWLDRLAVERSASELATFYHRARTAAIFRGTQVRLEFGADSLRAVAEGVGDSTLFVVPGPAQHGATLAVSQAIIRLYANGLGLGSANTKLVVRRGAAAESLTTSRLGRLKRW